MEFSHEGRKEAFRALVGSYNYNLNGPTSDKDYKVFIFPTFDDLYSNTKFGRMYVGNDEDLDVHDVRELGNLFFKSNMNFLELLFTNELKLSTDNDKVNQDLIHELFSMKDDIARMNLQNLYKSTVGTFDQRMRKLNKGTDATQSLVDKYEYNTKEAMNAIRGLDFLKKFADNDFSNFKEAIFYKKDDDLRAILLGIKNGLMRQDSFERYAERNLEVIKNYYEPIYTKYQLVEETNNKLLDIIKSMVKHNAV